MLKGMVKEAKQRLLKEKFVIKLIMGEVMDKYPLLRKGLVCGIVVLFLGLSIMPLVGSLSVENRVSIHIPIYGTGSRDTDTTPPVTTATLNPPEPNANGWYNTIVWVTLNATDNESGVNVTYYQINDEGWGIYTQSFYVPEYGFIVVEFYSIDNAGNAEVPKQVEFKVDLEPPNITISLDPSSPDGNNGWYIGNITVTVNATDSLSGVNATYYRYSSQSQWQIYTGPFNLTDDFPRAYILSKDNADNFFYCVTPSLKIDREPPNLVVNKQVFFNRIVYTACASDSLSGVAYVEFYLNDVLKFTENGSGPTFEWTLTPIPHINGIVKVIAYDCAGNNASISANTSNSFEQNQQSTLQSNPSLNPQSIPGGHQINQLFHNLIFNLMLRHQMMS